MISIGLAFYVVAFAFALGTLVGRWLADKRWRESAPEPMRVESGGRLYHVIAEGDLDKARDTVDWFVADKQRAYRRSS